MDPLEVLCFPRQQAQNRGSYSVIQRLLPHIWRPYINLQKQRIFFTYFKRKTHFNVFITGSLIRWDGRLSFSVSSLLCCDLMDLTSEGLHDVHRVHNNSTFPPLGAGTAGELQFYFQTTQEEEMKQEKKEQAPQKSPKSLIIGGLDWTLTQQVKSLFEITSLMWKEQMTDMWINCWLQSSSFFTCLQNKV